jgi:hypothetical protein
MTARLDQSAPGAGRGTGEGPASRRRRPDDYDGPGDDLDVPEFMPRD